MSDTNQLLADEFRQEAIHLLEQAMIKIEHCASQLTEDQIWWRPNPTANSIGNLLLHLSGNLNQWAVCGVGGGNDNRDRASEFETQNGVEKEKLMANLRSVVSKAIDTIKLQSDADLIRDLTVQGFQVSALAAISHTSTHFVGHTHQIIYITRLQLGESYKFQWTTESDQSHVPI